MPCTIRPAGSWLAVVGADGTARATGDAWRAARRLFYVRGGDGAVVAVRCATDADGDAVGGVVDGLAGKVSNIGWRRGGSKATASEKKVDDAHFHAHHTHHRTNLSERRTLDRR